MKKVIVLLVLISVTSLCGSVMADPVEILPVDYSFDKATDTGNYTYHDETGSQLTDGQYGVAPWNTNLGNGTAYEWVGWVYDTPVNIDFNFGTSTEIDIIHIGSVQDHPDDVVLPSIDIYSGDGTPGGWSFQVGLSVPEENSNNDTYKTFHFSSLVINDQYVRISLIHSLNGPWTLVDEVDFFQESASVPEPSLGLLLGISLVGLVGAGAVRKIRQKAVVKVNS